MIVIWGASDDPPTAAVLEALDRDGAPYRLVDQLAPPPPAKFSFGAEVTARVGEVDLNAAGSAFIRPLDAGDLAARGALFPGAAAVHQCLLAWSELTPALVVTRLSAQASNTAKLYQAAAIAEAGFAVPASLATTDPAAARAFVERHRAVVYKSLSGVRSIVRRLPSEELDRLADVRACPTLFQEHVEGTDVRVHVVGREVFATEVRSDADDYRYDRGTALAAAALPEAVAERCVALARSLALPLAGLDLRRPTGGEWVCFEVNPAPAFPYFEQATEVADAVARLLASAAALTPRPSRPAS